MQGMKLGEYFIRKETFDALSDAEQSRLKAHAAAFTWYVNRTSGITHLYIRVAEDCPAEVQERLGELRREIGGSAEGRSMAGTVD